MQEVIEKLLILQDRDRNIHHTREELARIGPQREALLAKTSSTAMALEAAKLKVKQIETERKKLELDVETKKGQIEKYSLQQFQTKKNEEYRALAHEIEGCKAAIIKIDDSQIELMEQTEVAQKGVAAATVLANEAKKAADAEVAELGGREQNLKKELAELESNREQLASVIDDATRSKYERLLKGKGTNVVVGVQHGVCGGCHMKLPMSVIVNCKAQEEIVTCINCGRILFYTRDMDVVAAD